MMKYLCELSFPGKGMNLFKMLLKEGTDEDSFQDNVIRLLKYSNKGMWKYEHSMNS